MVTDAVDHGSGTAIIAPAVKIPGTAHATAAARWLRSLIGWDKGSRDRIF